MRMIEYIRGVVLGVVFVGCLLAVGCVGEEVSLGDGDSSGKESSPDRYTWMTMNIPWRGVFGKPFSWGKEVKESDKPEIELGNEDEFTVYVTLGSSKYMVYNVVSIRSDGMVIAAYKDQNSYQYYQKKFSLLPSAVQKFRQILQKNHAGAMPASVITTENTPQEVQGGFTLESGGEIRRSYFNNAWPNSFKNIVNYINSNILCYNPIATENGFASVQKSILTVDPEATLAIRGLLNGK